jgi:hypothetical protein
MWLIWYLTIQIMKWYWWNEQQRSEGEPHKSLYAGKCDKATLQIWEYRKCGMVTIRAKKQWQKREQLILGTAYDISFCLNASIYIKKLEKYYSCTINRKDPLCLCSSSLTTSSEGERRHIHWQTGRWTSFTSNSTTHCNVLPCSNMPHLKARQ